MELPESLIFYDGVVFLLGVLFALLYLYHISRTLKFNCYTVVLFFLYVIFSYSSYNIMVMPIHDYNVAVARNFIYHYKVLSILSIADVLFIVLFFVVLALWGLKREVFVCVKLLPPIILFLIAIVMIQGGVIALLSTSGFLYYVMHDGVGLFKNQLIYFRGVVCFFVLIYLFCHSLKGLVLLGFYKVIAIFCFFDLINFTSSLISSCIYYDFLWERYGVKVTIIDQDKIYNYFTLYSLMIFAFVFSRVPNKFLVCFATIIIGAAMYFNVYKFLFAIAALFILYDIFVSFRDNKLSKLKVATVILVVITTLPVLINLYSSKSMNTRSSQVSDYWEYTGKYFPANIIGIGYGGLYYSPTGIADKGETKKFDLELLGGHYKRSIQTPLLTQLKNSGLLGLLFMLMIAIFCGIRMISINLKLTENVFSSAICFNIIWLVGSGCILLQPYPMPALTFVKLLLLLFLLLHANKRQDEMI
ncbi:hypothetical protein, partial [Serratia marcescens]|uniref:hypothetical protein n=1 Tax=Serratia marcescens TaxID=615 RepID=UPI001CA42795